MESQAATAASSRDEATETAPAEAEAQVEEAEEAAEVIDTAGEGSRPETAPGSDPPRDG